MNQWIMRARFKVYLSYGWLTCIPKNDEAKKIINGKLGAVWPGPRIPEIHVPFEYTKSKKHKI